MIVNKQLLEIEIPAGWRAVAYRIPVLNETILDNDGNIKIISVVGKDKEIIVIRAWSPPSWFPKKGWLFQSGGSWWISLIEPTAMSNGQYSVVIGQTVLASFLAELLGQTFTPPQGITITDL